MFNLPEFSRGFYTDGLGWTIFANEMWMLPFQRNKFFAQRVIFCVGQGRIIILIIERIRRANFARKPSDPLFSTHDAINCRAAARASCVMVSPASMRAISSSRSASKIGVTDVVVVSPVELFSMRN